MEWRWSGSRLEHDSLGLEQDGPGTWSEMWHWNFPRNLWGEGSKNCYGVDWLWLIALTSWRKDHEGPIACAFDVPWSCHFLPSWPFCPSRLLASQAAIKGELTDKKNQQAQDTGLQHQHERCPPGPQDGLTKQRFRARNQNLDFEHEPWHACLSWQNWSPFIKCC